jgi:transforming growth factor-beta-induced protein
MRGRTTKFAALIGVAALTLAACGDDSNDDDAATDTTEAAADEPADDMAAEPADDMADEPADDMADEPADDMADEPGTIVDVAASTDGFSTLVAAVEAAGLVETLSGEGPFTVFAPTDDAFAAALDALGLTADELLADTDTLTAILTYHVVPGEVPSSDVVTLDGQSVETVNGASVDITVDGDTVMVNDATVTAVDVEASNGVIHVIDTVLLPPES